MQLFYSPSSYLREAGNFPYLPVINMYAEEAPTEGDGVVALISRPGFNEQGITMGDGPVTALYQESGVLGGSLFGISGTSVYRGLVFLGSLDGDGEGRIGGYRDRLFFNKGQTITSFAGSTYDSIDFPDDADVLTFTIANSRLVAIRKDTQMFYWSDPLSDTINGLSFASAESSPDNLLDILYVGDRLLLFGSSTVETWIANPENPDLPFQPLSGATFPTGIKNTDACCKVSTAFLWVSNTNKVCFGSPENVISFPGLEARIANADRVVTFPFYIDGREFVCVRFDDQSWIWKVDTNTWSQFETYGRSDWAISSFSNGCLGSSVDGKIYVWSDNFIDQSSINLERRFRAWLPITSDHVVAHNIILRTSQGNTNYFPNAGLADPEIEMRTSRDGGRRWFLWQKRSLGWKGEYRHQVYWNGCGFFTYPGLMVEFRVTAPVPFRVSGVVANEPVGGS